MEEYEEVLRSDLPEVEKLAQAFGRMTGRVVEQANHEIELARAMQDRELVVKAQIKVSVMEHSREIFEQCYRWVTGMEAWHEQDSV